VPVDNLRPEKKRTRLSPAVLSIKSIVSHDSIRSMAIRNSALLSTRSWRSSITRRLDHGRPWICQQCRQRSSSGKRASSHSAPSLHSFGTYFCFPPHVLRAFSKISSWILWLRLAGMARLILAYRLVACSVSLSGATRTFPRRKRQPAIHAIDVSGVHIE
jgi:hypothetical protein